MDTPLGSLISICRAVSKGAVRSLSTRRHLRCRQGPLCGTQSPHLCTAIVVPRSDASVSGCICRPFSPGDDSFIKGAKTSHSKCVLGGCLSRRSQTAKQKALSFVVCQCTRILVSCIRYLVRAKS